MNNALFKLDITTAFEDSVGTTGASKQRYEQLLEKLLPTLPRIRKSPQREAEPVLGLPSAKDDLAEIEAVGKSIREQFSTLVVVGMGGSSLSGETLALTAKPSPLKLVFVDNIDPVIIGRMCEALDWKKTAFLVISKSGNTIETLAHMSVLLRHAKAAGIDPAKHFTVITIPDGNSLETIAKAYNINVIPHDPKLGGRFAILSAVGLIPAAAIGMDIRALRAGAQKVLEDNFDRAPGDSARSAALHVALMDKNTRINVMMHYCNRLEGLASWYRQCWGESLGKCAAATTPVRSRGATDQHSQLQLYLDGPKDKLFTFMTLNRSGQGDAIDFPELSDTRFDFLKGQTMGDLMVAEQKGTLGTLVKRGCPVRAFEMDVLNEEVLGGLLMHFALEIMFTAELMQVNAFDQPAVEESKVLTMQYLLRKTA